MKWSISIYLIYVRNIRRLYLKCRHSSWNLILPVQAPYAVAGDIRHRRLKLPLQIILFLIRRCEETLVGNRATDVTLSWITQHSIVRAPANVQSTSTICIMDRYWTSVPVARPTPYRALRCLSTVLCLGSVYTGYGHMWACSQCWAQNCNINTKQNILQNKWITHLFYEWTQRFNNRIT